MTAARRRMALAAAFALALHAIALWALRHAALPTVLPAEAQAPRLQAVLLIAEPVRPSAPEADRPAAPRSTARKSRSPVQSAANPVPLLAQAPEAAPITAAPPPTGLAKGSAAAQFLDSAASQRAIREAAASRRVPLNAHAPAPSPWENAIQSASHGDCMKGEFVGSDMGLLSLPMLAAAMARGQCRQ